MNKPNAPQLFQEEEFRRYANNAGPLPRQFVWSQRAGSDSTEDFLVTEQEQPASASYDLEYEDGEKVKCALYPLGVLLLHTRRLHVYLLCPPTSAN